MLADSHTESLDLILICNQHSKPKKPIGESANKRKTGAKGVGNVRRRIEDPLLACVSKVRNKFEVMPNTVVNNHDGNINSLVRDEVQRASASYTHVTKEYTSQVRQSVVL